MRKDLTIKIFKYLTSNISLQLLNLISLFILMTALSVDEYGEYFYVVELLVIFSMIADSGTRTFYVKEITQSNNPKEHLAKINASHYIISILSFILIAIISNEINYDYKSLIVVGLGYTLISLFVPLQAYFISTESVRVIAIREQLIGLSRLIYFIIGWKFSLDVTYFLSYIYFQFAIILAYWVIINETQDFSLFKVNHNGYESINSLRKIIPFSMLIVVNLIYNKIDIYMLELIDGFDSVGVYTAATKLVYPFMFLSGVFMTAIFPKMARYSNSQEQTEQVAIYALVSLPFIGLILSVFLYVISGYVYHNLWDGKFLDSLIVYKMLVVYLPIVFTYGVLTNIMVAKGHIRQLLIINFLGLMLNVILNSWLIPEFSAQGAAGSTIICETYILIVSFIYLIKKIKLNLNKTISIFILTFSFLVLGYVYYQFK